MANCTCGAPIVWKDRDGERVAFDAHEAMQGEARYVEGQDGLVPVSPTANVLAWQEHAETCPNARR